jgi:hypothetical protein
MRACEAGCRITDAHRDGCASSTCRGCLPREAKVGYLCEGCYARLADQLHDWAKFSQLVLAFGTLVQTDNDGRKSRPSGYTTLEQTFLDIDEAERFLQPLSGVYGLADAGGDARKWVSTVRGANNAANFTKCAERCRRSHEIAQADGKLRKWRCPNCHQTNPHDLTLWLKQPRFAGDDRVISCVKECGYLVSMDRASTIADVESAVR